MRGKRNRFWCLGYANRNIPAYAGKTSIPHNLFCPLMEHPRVCGENPIIPAAERGHDGTSPRMRGKQTRQIRPIRIRRNIPAYAGKTGVVPRLITSAAEHPRVCGENLRAPASRVRLLGTSPRMRGKPELTRRMTRTLRNIPAYAGKTQPSGRAHRSHQEHPRVCGENQLLFWPGAKAHGTSPRMRGKRPSKIFFRFRYRNIPAYAGKTPRRGSC